jgi:hypothetical protein
MLASLTTLLASIVDYAGLFPPAKLGMRVAALAPTLPQSHTDEVYGKTKPWPLSLVMSSNRSDELALELERVLSSRSALSRELLASHDIDCDVDIVALEFPPLPPTEVRHVLTQIPPGVDSFFELRLDESLESYLAMLQGTGACAKIRTGGITADAFPSVHQVSQFILACAQAHVPFKATAGLHHLLPGVYPMTYEPNSRSTQMHGFLNVGVSAALAYCKTITFNDVVTILQSTSIDSFQFRSDAVVWNKYDLSLEDLQNTRKNFFQAFGSCSFKEPILDIQTQTLTL